MADHTLITCLPMHESRDCTFTDHVIEGNDNVAQMVKSLPSMQETQVPSLGQGDALEKGEALCETVLPNGGLVEVF